MGSLRSITTWIGAALLAAGCGRDFQKPPPEPAQVRIDSVSPEAGYFDSPVTIQGAHFASPASANLVFFGSQSATLDEGASQPDQGRLVVRVPALQTHQRYAVTVSNATGQATADDDQAFTYRGAGHPLAEQIDHILALEAAPNAVSVVLPGEQLDQFNPILVTNSASRNISLMDLDTGWRMDLGIPGAPISAVLLPKQLEIGDPQDPNNPFAAWLGGCYQLRQFALYTSVLLFESDDPAQPDELRTNTRSFELTFVTLDSTALPGACLDSWRQHQADGNWFQVQVGPLSPRYDLDPAALAPAKLKFLPTRISSLCLELAPGPGVDPCAERLLVITDLYRPLVALVAYRPDDPTHCLQPITPFVLDTGQSACRDEGDYVGPVVDLAHRPGEPSFLISARNRPEIWRVALLPGSDPPALDEVAVAWPRAELTSAALADLLAAGWNPDVLGPERVCEPRISAMAIGAEQPSADPLDNTPDRVFLADATSQTVLEIEWVSLPALPGIGALAPRGAVHLGGAVFGLQAALEESADPTATRPWLYAATDQGLLIIALDPLSGQPMQPVGRLDLPGFRGQADSLARYGQADDRKPDRLALVDTVRNQIIALTAGDLQTAPAILPAGSVLPQVAASQWDDRLYLADPLSNTIRLIDQNTGLQAGKFPVGDLSAFGALSITCLHDYDSDLLLVPLAAGLRDPLQARAQFAQIAVRQAKDAQAIESFGKGLDDSQLRDALGHIRSMAHAFHEVLVAPLQHRIYLVQYPPAASPDDPSPNGLVWPAAISPSLELDKLLLDGQELADADPQGVTEGRPLQAWVSLLRLSSDEQLLVAYGVQPDSAAGRIEVYPADDPYAAPIYTASLEPPSSLLVNDLVARRQGENLSLYLPLTEAGLLLELALDLTPGAAGQYTQAYLETTGAPWRSSLSPDGRRLYVAHRFEGKLSVIDTECPAPGCPAGQACPPELCARLIASIPVEANPDRVVFHPAGDTAYLTHEGSNRITVVR